MAFNLNCILRSADKCLRTTQVQISVRTYCRCRALDCADFKDVRYCSPGQYTTLTIPKSRMPSGPVAFAGVERLITYF